MELKGILDTSLGNFLCIRGYASLGDLHDVSDYDSTFQRTLITKHRQEVVDFLSNRKFLFFPEVILGAELSSQNASFAVVNLFEEVGYGNNFNLDFENFKIKCSVTKTQSKKDSRVKDFFRRVVLTINKNTISNSIKPFTRIDGNHRISAANESNSLREIVTPFCIILFRNTQEKEEFSRVIFNNINSKSIPVSVNHSTRLILENVNTYPDEELKSNSSFGMAYYFSRKIYNSIDFELLPAIHQSFFSTESDGFEEAGVFLKIFSFLLTKESISDAENSIRRFKNALSRINNLYEKNEQLAKSKNDGLLAAFVHYELTRENEATLPAFYDWVVTNHLALIEYLHPQDLISVFDNILSTKSRTIFVSMPFGKANTDNHFNIIERICKEINEQFKLKHKLKAERVDWFDDGTSYNISDKILNMISACGMLIGDLTFARPNVYHEIGFMMGRDKALGRDNNNFILILDETVSKEDQSVGFNLQGIKQIRFTETEVLAAKLKENITKFYNLKPI